MRPPDIFFTLPLGLVILVLLDGIRGETCSAVARAKPGENLTALRAKAIANFESACRVKNKPSESPEDESCSFVTEPAKYGTKSVLEPLSVPFRLNFTVRTGGDAAVVLSTSTFGGSSVEIFLGSQGNSQSSIRFCFTVHHCSENSPHREPGMVSAAERRPFWVEYRDNGTLAVGKGGLQQAFMEEDLTSLSASFLHVGIASRGNVQADWVFYQFCEQPGDPLLNGAVMVPKF